MKKLLQKNGVSSFLSALIAIAAGIFLGFFILLIANSGQALRGLGMILRGGFVSMREIGQLLYDATPIIMTGLSVGFANKCGLFNIGGPGQFVVGGYMAILVGVKATFLPGATQWIVALLAAALAGAVWGLIPGLLKALFQVNEVISCIMMNYIGMSFVNMLVRRTVYDSTKNQSLLPTGSALLPKMGLDKVFVSGGTASSANSGILIALLVGVLMYIIVSKSRFGFELRACGLNRDAAKYAGINEKRSIMLSMAIAGALAGLGGALLYLSGAGRALHVVDTLAQEGFNGIPVALLGMNHPIGIIFAGIFVANLTRGGFNMQVLGYVPEVIAVIIAVIIYLSAFALFFRQVLQGARRRKPAVSGSGKDTAPPPAKTQKGGEEA